jgi:ATPase family protein associated with various cellular activities (AAA)/winged helix domain-containing protein
VASTADPPAPAAVTLGFLAERIRAAVQEVAGHDANPTDPFRGLYISDDLALSLAGADPGATFDERLAEAAARLRLDPLDTAVLGLCAAPELSPRYGRLFAYLQDDVTRKLATPRLVSELLQGPGVTAADVLRCFAADAPLRRDGALRLLDGEAVAPLAERAVKLGERLASFLLGARLDSGASNARLCVVPVRARDPGRAQTVRRLAALLACDPPLPVIVAGPDAAALVAAAVAQPLLLADVRELGDRDLMAEANLVCALEGRRLCFDGLELIEPADRARLLRALEQRPGGVVMITPSRAAALALGDRTTIVLEAPMPSLQERAGAWAQIGGTDDVRDVAAKFRLSIGQIHEAAEVAVLAAAARGAATPTARDLDEGARQASSSRLGELAARLDPVHRWPDLVLPERQLSLLKSISSYLRHRDLVLQQWGYERTVARTQGLKAMFAGESGTGKTMAAQVLANELGLELYRVDLATVVSKYIGETEKNLDRIFAAAEGSNAILFFDEADALFGKRSGVSDAHDRYANIEVAYLLQKMEGYAGAVILATNFRSNIDDAFLRRLDFVVDFPFPEADDRRRIWELLLPEQAPVGDDVDLEFLATRFKLSGGGIRNCSLAAAFIAAEERGVIGMEHLVRAVALEYGKLGRLTLEADFERFHGLLRGQQHSASGV